MELEEYNNKRDFYKTPEPRGEVRHESNAHRFVVQRHQARKLHYDLRLEINGTLKSWAVPKGPSMNPSDKRLAVRTEDHPLNYLHFQGTIPKRNYGTGDMGIWDTGTYDVDRTDVDIDIFQQFQQGNLKLIFSGKNLKGRFALVRTGERDGKESWLFIKKKDQHATDLFYDAEALLESPAHLNKGAINAIAVGQTLSPMLATPAQHVFNDPKWLYELKWDGYRVLAHVTQHKVVLQSRNGISLNKKFPTLVKELEALGNEVILDGEVVVLDSMGVAKFGELQNYPDTKATLQYYVFDMLYLNGHRMLDLPLLDRKRFIPEVINGLRITRFCDHIEGMGTALFKNAIDAGVEGIMAKKMDSRYAPGIRTENWLKIKSVETMDVLICGYTNSVNGGAAFGSLILGIQETGTLRYIGNCGSGFGANGRETLLNFFQTYRTSENPFHKKLALRGRKPNWMVPTLECEVSFSERTKKGFLRNPVFKKLLHYEDIPVNSKGSPVKRAVSKTKELIEIDGLPVPISNLDKIYWPRSGLTKYDLIDYYIKISETILPYLRDRPQSLHRHPNGIMEESFYQKDNEHVPEWIQTIKIYSKSSERDIDYLLCQNTASLIYMANLGCIEINPWNSRSTDLDKPDYGIIDLDPPEGMDFKAVRHVALTVKNILDEAEIQGYCKTSGAKGLHIYLPMGSAYRYEEVRSFIKLLCYYILQREPRIATMERRINARKGKIYLDYLQNRKGQTVASVYSVRPVIDAKVSAPIDWDELSDGIVPDDFTLANMKDRIETKGDLFAPAIKASIAMEKAIERLEKLQS